MKLDEAITWLERKAENDEELARISISERAKLLNQKNAAKNKQLAEWLRDLKRADTLLKATYELLNKQHESYYVLNLLAETVYYDEAECDGNCLMEDIDAWMYERGIDYDTTRD